MKKALIVVDYQKDFVTGSLGFEAAVKLEQPIYDKVLSCKDNGADVYFTMDTHEPDYLSTEEGKNLPIEHCIRGTDGWKLYGKVASLCDETAFVFSKPTFPSLELANALSKNGYDAIELVGIVSNICVISNAVMAKAALPNAHIIVDASCTAGVDADLHKKAFDVMKGLQIEVINEK